MGLDEFKERVFRHKKMRELKMCVGVIREGRVRQNGLHSPYTADAFVRPWKSHFIPLNLSSLILRIPAMTRSPKCYEFQV